MYQKPRCIQIHRDSLTIQVPCGKSQRWRPHLDWFVLRPSRRRCRHKPKHLLPYTFYKALATHVFQFAQYRCLRNKCQSKPYEFTGFGAMDVTKPYEFTWFSDIPGRKPYKFIGLRWAFISQTPVVLPGDVP